MSRLILDLCGGTGSWSKPYREAGYTVELVTLPCFDVRRYMAPENVYGVLAAPPCTMFSVARQRAKKPRDFREGMEVVEACLKLIWQCRYDGALKFWAMENPRGYLRQFMGRPAATFEPWEYGDEHSKKTDLWGYFNMPKKAFDSKHLFVKEQDAHWQNPSRPQGFEKLTRQEVRSITPSGFARAFYLANP